MCHRTGHLSRGNYPDALVVKASLRVDRGNDIGTVVYTVHVTFQYDPENPFDIDFMFAAPDSGSCTWLLGREQLIEGLLKGSCTTTFSVRQVTVISAEGEAEPALLRLILRGMRSRAVFEMELGPVRQWLVGTLAAVEAGTEGLRLDWDGFLAGLTNGRF
jgi:hypothetical protein